jgi:alpha-glucosidase
MNGTQPKKIKIPLSFLKNGNYKATVVSDDPANPAAEIVKQESHTASDVIDLDLVSGGGYIAFYRY